MRPHRTLATAVVAGTLAATLSFYGATPARADAVRATRADTFEVAHEIDVRMDRGHATLVVRRVVQNTAARSDQAVAFIDIPDGAVATRLRSEGAPGQWFEGDLLEAQDALRKYTELSGFGGAAPKDPAILYWRRQGQLMLQVFPVPARGRKVVEYTLEMPAPYDSGVYSLQLPVLGTPQRPATVRARAGTSGDEIIVASTPNVGTTISLRPRGVGVPMLGGLASEPASAEHTLVRAHLEVAPKLGVAPTGAHVAVVIDRSRSMRAHWPAALAATRAYLTHMKDARVEIITFTRKVEEPLGRNLSVSDALAKLTTLNPTSRNGSELELAVSRADELLAQGAPGARRMLVISDTMVRPSLEPKAFGARTLKSRALVHMARVQPGAPSLARQDDDDWATLPRRTGGLFYAAHAADFVDDDMRTTFEEWARPTRIEKFEITGLTGHGYVPEVMEEGHAYSFFDLKDAGVSRFTARGELWSTPVSRTFEADPDEGRRAAALVFGSHLHSSLNSGEQMVLARRGHAVSPVTSFLAIEPGVRPSIDGLEEPLQVTGIGEGGGGRGEGIGLGNIGLVGRGGGTPDRDAFLRSMVAAAKAACGAPGRPVHVKVQTTVDEIVHVTDVRVGPDRDAMRESCITEKLWTVELPAMFDSDADEFDLDG